MRDSDVGYAVSVQVTDGNVAAISTPGAERLKREKCPIAVAEQDPARKNQVCDPVSVDVCDRDRLRAHRGDFSDC